MHLQPTFQELAVIAKARIPAFPYKLSKDLCSYYSDYADFALKHYLAASSDEEIYAYLEEKCQGQNKSIVLQHGANIGHGHVYKTYRLKVAGKPALLVLRSGRPHEELGYHEEVLQFADRIEIPKTFMDVGIKEESLQSILDRTSTWEEIFEELQITPYSIAGNLFQALRTRLQEYVQGKDHLLGYAT